MLFVIGSREKPQRSLSEICGLTSEDITLEVEIQDACRILTTYTRCVCRTGSVVKISATQMWYHQQKAMA